MSMSKKDKYFKQLKEAEEKKELLNSYLRGGHKFPTTRREFLASGLLSATTTLLAPTLPQLISRTAWADELGCTEADSSAGGFPAFIHVQLAGGAALFANSLTCLADGQPFNNYARLGMGSQPPRGNFFANNAPFWVASDTSAGSPIFTQMFSALGTDNMDIVNQSAFVQVCAESLDDTSNNPQDITGMLQAAGVSGSQLPYLSSGGNNRFQPAILPSANLLRSNSAPAIEGSLQFSGALGSFRGNNQEVSNVHGALAQLIENLNKYQAEQLARTPSSHESQKIFKNLIQCASAKNTSLQGQAPVVDIFDNNFPGGNDLATIWQTLRDGNTVPNNVVDQTSHTIGACMTGLASVALISLGGYDYHLGRNRTQSDQKDREVGEVLAGILLSAKARNRKTFIWVSTDGSLNSAQDDGAPETTNWTGDLSNRSAGYIIAYDPSQTVQTAGFAMGNYRDASFQLNHFDDSYSVANENPMGAIDANDLYTAAVFLNYLNFAGQPNLIDRPELADVKRRLQDAAPGATSIFDYFTRIKGVG